MSKVPSYSTIKIQVVFPPDEPPPRHPRISVLGNSAHRVINPGRDNIATFHGLPAGRTVATVRVDGVFAGDVDIEIPVEGEATAVIHARYAMGSRHALDFNAAQCNLEFGGAPDAAHPDTHKRGREVRLWARAMSNYRIRVLGLQEAHVYRIPFLNAELESATGEEWTFVRHSMGVFTHTDFDGEKPRRRHSGVAIFWQNKYFERVGKKSAVTYWFGRYKLIALGVRLRARRNGQLFWFWTFKLPWDDLIEHNSSADERRVATLRFRRFIRQARGGKTPVIVAMDMNTLQGVEDGHMLTNAFYRWVVAGKYRVASHDGVDHLLYKGSMLVSRGRGTIPARSDDYSDHNFPYSWFSLKA